MTDVAVGGVVGVAESGAEGVAEGGVDETLGHWWRGEEEEGDIWRD